MTKTAEEIAAGAFTLIRHKQTQRRDNAFQHRYWNDPAGFIRDCIEWQEGEEPADYQIDALMRLATERRVSLRAPHGVGKSAIAALAILWFALTRDSITDWKIPVTASVWRQLEKYLFPELHKWANRLQWETIGRERFKSNTELLTLSLKLSTGECFAVASDQPYAIEGAHASQMLYILDEAKSIPARTWEAVEGAFSNAGADTTSRAYSLAISTPGEPSGVFYDMHVRRPGYEDWSTAHITLQQAIEAGRISQTWADQRARQWGRNSPVYLNRVLGEFADSGTDSLIPLSWVEAAMERWQQWGGLGIEGNFTAYAVDPARFGGDSTSIARRVGNFIEKLEYGNGWDTMQTAGEVIARVGVGNKAVPIMVDVIGIGAGVVDRLKEQEYKAVSVNVGEAAKDRLGKDLRDASGELTFLNLRAWGWWMLRDLLDPNHPEGIALPPDDRLLGDLTAPTWKTTSSGRIQIESKDDIRKRLGRSTDAADVVMLAFMAEPFRAAFFKKPPRPAVSFNRDEGKPLYRPEWNEVMERWDWRNTDTGHIVPPALLPFRA